MLFLRTGMTRLEVIDALKAHGLPPNSSALVCTQRDVEGEMMTACEIDTKSGEWQAVRPSEEPQSEAFQFTIARERLVYIAHVMRFSDGDRARLTAGRVEGTAQLLFGRPAVRPDKRTARSLFGKGNVIESFGWNTPKSALFALYGKMPDADESPDSARWTVLVVSAMTGE